jgi:hypothetical protein
MARHDGGMQPTLLSGDKIRAILSVRTSENGISIYRRGAADGQAVS